MSGRMSIKHIDPSCKLLTCIGEPHQWAPQCQRYVRLTEHQE